MDYFFHHLELLLEVIKFVIFLLFLSLFWIVRLRLYSVAVTVRPRILYKTTTNVTAQRRKPFPILVPALRRKAVRIIINILRVRQDRHHVRVSVSTLQRQKSSKKITPKSLQQP